jgi:PAS domain S-box-containing protein
MLEWFFDSSDFVPRRICGNWSKELILVHNIADLAIFAAYFAIPAILAYFMLKRRDMPFPRLIWLFALFIVGCGLTHLMGFIVFTYPAYRLDAAVKIFTAIVSWLTVIALIPSIPKIMAMRTPQELEAEIERRKAVEEELRLLKERADTEVVERTRELRETNLLLREQMEARQKISAELGRQAQDLVELQKATVQTCAILDSMMQLAPVGMGFFDSECRFVRVNDHLAAINGKPPAEHLGKTLEELLGDDIGHKVKPRLRDVLASGQAILNEETKGKIHGNGEHIWLTSYYPVYTPDQKMLGVGVVVEDITQQKRVETELRNRVMELAQTDRQKTEFLAMLAHELRNPLAPIMNSVYVLQSTANPERLEKVAETYDLIIRQVKHMTRLLDDLLDVARLNKGKISLRKEPVDVNEAVLRCIELHRPSAETRHHEIIRSLCHQPLVVNADPTRLEQMISNLLGNAIKYTEPTGRIELRTSLTDNWVYVTVRDNGIGIAPHVLPKLFEIFAQASRSLDRAQGGLGIGLALSQDLARMHGGEIIARSDGLGQGSEFSIRLPLMQVKLPQRKDKAVKFTKATKPLRIMIVDDNHDAADSLAMLLREKGHEAWMMYDGASALKKLNAYAPHVVLLDIGLPGLDGFTCCELMLESGFKGLIVAITGYGAEEDKRRSKEAGFSHHLTKPVDPEELSVLLNAYAEKEVVT